MMPGTGSRPHVPPGVLPDPAVIAAPGAGVALVRAPDHLQAQLSRLEGGQAAGMPYSRQDHLRPGAVIHVDGEKAAVRGSIAS
jgi:hypothetical protein